MSAVTMPDGGAAVGDDDKNDITSPVDMPAADIKTMSFCRTSSRFDCALKTALVPPMLLVRASPDSKLITSSWITLVERPTGRGDFCDFCEKFDALLPAEPGSRSG